MDRLLPAPVHLPLRPLLDLIATHWQRALSLPFKDTLRGLVRQLLARDAN